MQERILYTHCPLCEAEEILPYRTGDCSQNPSYKQPLSPKIVWKACTKCNHVFTEGYYSDEALAIVFQNMHENQEVGYGMEANRVHSAEIIDQITPYRQNGTWLDVGCGNGSLLFTAQEYGFTPMGLDLRQQTVDDMRRCGIECHRSDICDFTYDKPIHVISMADVIEHIPYPKRALQSVRRLLGNDGLLMISTPNSESMLWKVSTDQGKNPYWGEMEHYHNFSRSRLYALLDEVGLRVLKFRLQNRYRMGMEIIAQAA